MSSVESLGGALGKEQLFSLLAYLKSTRALGRLALQSSNRYGSIYLRAGEVVHAEVGTLTGEAAVAHMVTWSEGTFSFRANEQSPKDTITDSLESLALSIAVAIDHGAIPEPGKAVDLSHAARVKPQPADVQLVLEGTELTLLSRINPGVSLEQLGAELGWTNLQLQHVAQSLVARKMIELLEPVRLASVNPGFVGALRQIYAEALGPAAEFLFDDVANGLGIDTRSLRPDRFSDFLRGLADAIDDPNARTRFIERLKQIRTQFGI
jgi:Domain of unknown function (DUF4388)